MEHICLIFLPIMLRVMQQFISQEQIFEKNQTDTISYGLQKVFAEGGGK